MKADVWVAVLTGALALATFVLAWVTYREGVKAERRVGKMIKHDQRNQREARDFSVRENNRYLIYVTCVVGLTGSVLYLAQRNRR